MKAVMLIILIVLVIAMLLHYLFPAIEVCGNSMCPTYHDGEILVGTRLFRKSKLKKDDVVLYKSPNEESRIVIKRIYKVKDLSGDLYFYFMGDNSRCSHDSRHYGYVSHRNIVCKVIDQRPKLVEVNNNE